MRTIILIFLFITFSQLSTAPTIDFRLRMIKTRMMIGYAEEKCREWEFNRFVSDLGFRESSNNWLSVNRIGCFGEWQFAESTLKYLGYKHVTTKRFRSDPSIFPRDKQLEALKALIKVNMCSLKNYQHFIGDTINGIVVTKSGMVAASHLGGAGSLKRLLDTNGRVNRKDILGTSVCDYLKRFHDYNF